MASPFEYFRRNQKVMMVWVTILAMFSFIVLGTIAELGSDETMLANFPMAMGLLLGGIALGMAFKGTTWQWPSALAGALLGAWIGSYLGIDAVAGQPAVKMKNGNLTQVEVQNLVAQRGMANQFVQQAFIRSNPQMMQMASNPMFQNFIMQMIQQASFGFGLETQEKDVVLGELLRREAQAAGMVVSNEFVSEFINQVTRQSLSTQDFGEILRGMRLSDVELYDILRSELMARQALMIFRPKVDPTPEQLWSLYAKSEMRQSLDVIPVSVSSFVDQVSAPSDADLKAFFEAHKNVFPNSEGEGSVGFRQPERAIVAYLEADYAAFEKLAGEVTDAEIAEYYEKNKERYKNEVFPEEMKIDDLSFPGLDGATSPLSSNDALSQPMTSTDVLSTPLTSSEVLSTPMTSTDVSPALVEVTPNGTTPEPSPETPTETKPETPATPEGQPQSNLVTPADVIQLVSFQAEQPAPAETAPAQPAPATEDKPAEPTAAPTAAPEAPPSETTPPASPVSGDAKPAAEQPASPSMPEEPSATPSDAPATETPGDQPAQKQPEYRPLDDELKADIRAQLLRERTQAKMQSAMTSARGVLFDLGNTLTLSKGNPDRQSPEQINARMKEYASTNNLRFAQTGWVSFRELTESEDHPIGQAIQPIDDPLARYDAETVPEMIFTGTPQNFLPFDAVDPDSQNRFVFWKSDYKAEHVPNFDDPGILAEVTKVWKSVEARKLAQARAEEIAQSIREKKDLPLSEVLAGMTEDGTDKSPQLVVTGTGSFSWYSQSTAAPTDMMPSRQPLTRTNLPEIVGGAGDEFMQAVFEKLSAGDVGVAPNSDKSIYYVTKVVFRDAESNLRDNLLGTKSAVFAQGSSARQLAGLSQQQANADWTKGLFEKYKVEFVEPEPGTTTPPDEEPS